ncbi:stabilizer of axonemal microtubules 5 [Paroedura picta]|uniref:stabilizer of axonemal microtubules 5 n=1 Tax=Paroedura picta TaxID=143630 RepID=UPI0040563C00
MEGCPRLESPAPLHGPAFFQASHFQLGFDRHPEGSTVVSPYRSEYPPRWGTHLRKPILPPACAGVLNQDMGEPWDPQPEYLAAYPAWPLVARPGLCPPASRLRMHADPRHHVFASTAQLDYTYPAKVLPPKLHHVDKWDDSIARGDKEKVPMPPSLYQQSYPAPEGLSPAARAPSQHLGSDSTLKADGKTRFGSSYRDQYMGAWAPPAQRCHGDLVSVVFGDPRCHDPVSEQRHAYSAPHPADLCCYDAERANRQLFQTSTQAGDGRRRFSTIMRESFRPKEAGQASISYPHRNTSSILRGDEVPQRNEGKVTTTFFYYGEPSSGGRKPLQPSSLEGQLTLRLGDPRLGSFSTTQQSDYCQPPETPKAGPQSSDHMKSNISFGFPDIGTSTTTQDMLVPHQLQKHHIPEELLQKIKHSHLAHPWRGQRWFSTEQREAYVDKYSGPVALVVGDCQTSSVPLGTMKKFSRRPQWPPGIQEQETIPGRPAGSGPWPPSPEAPEG